MNPTSGGHPQSGGAAPGGGARKAFVFYSNWYDDVATSLSLEQQQEFLLLIVRYASHGEEPSGRATPIVRSMFGLIRNVIDADLKKWEKIRAANQKRAAASAEKRRKKATAKEAPLNFDNQDFTADQPLHITNNTQPITQDASLAEKGEGEGEPVTGPAADDVDGESDAAASSNGPAASSNDAAASSKGPAVPTKEEVEDFWRAHHYRSSAREFYAYYSERGWRNSQGEPLRRWVIAANFWEEKFVKAIVPMKRREAEERRQALRADNERTAQEERAQQRAASNEEHRQRQARAVSPELGKYMYQRAVMLAGNDAAAMTLLRRASEDEAVRKRLAEGFYR